MRALGQIILRDPGILGLPTSDVNFFRLYRLGGSLNELGVGGMPAFGHGTCHFFWIFQAGKGLLHIGRDLIGGWRLAIKVCLDRPVKSSRLVGRD